MKMFLILILLFCSGVVFASVPESNVLSSLGLDLSVLDGLSIKEYIGYSILALFEFWLGNTKLVKPNSVLDLARKSIGEAIIKIFNLKDGWEIKE